MTCEYCNTANTDEQAKALEEAGGLLRFANADGCIISGEMLAEMIKVLFDRLNIQPRLSDRELYQLIQDSIAVLENAQKESK